MVNLFPNSQLGPLPLDAKLTSIVVPHRNTAIYRNNAFPEYLISALAPGLTTYHEMFTRAAEVHADRPCLSYRKFDYSTKKSAEEFTSISYKEADKRRLAIGSGILAALKRVLPDLVENHLNKYKSYDKDTHSPIISIFSGNRYEWTLCDVACHGYSLTNTALYDNLGDDVTLHLLQQTESPFVFCSGDKVRKVAKLTQENGLKVAVVVSFDPVTEGERALVKNAGVQFYTLTELEELGRTENFRVCPPHPSTLFTISFTSGTTGSKPKGVLLTHGNAVAAITFLITEIPQVPKGKAFIFLPLTHIYERQTSSFALMTGYNLGYPRLKIYNDKQDPFALLVEDLRLFKPHYFSIVPRLLTKLESHIKSHIATHPELRSITDIIKLRAHQQLTADFCEGEPVDFAPYKELRTLVGFDNLLWTQTASAPTNKSTLAYLKAALGIGINQLYGLTETFGAMTRSLSYEAVPGSCGSVGVAVEVKLEERKDMNYFVADGKGELLIRGHQLFSGYFKNDEETAKAMDDDGWFSSGDVAQIKDGKLYIIDRVKNFFKLAHGEYISPERIENLYLSKNPTIQQLYVHGHPSKDYVVGVVGVTLESGLRFLNKSSLTEEEMLEEINKPENKKSFLNALNANIVEHLNGIERLGNLHIEVNPLTVEKNVVTPTMKIKRGVAATHFKHVWAKLYDEEGRLVTKSKV